MQSIDQEGKTVEEALEKALGILNRAADEVDYEVLDEGSKGVLGVGARPVLIRVRAKDIPEMITLREKANSFLTDLGVDFSNLEVNLKKNDIIRLSMDTEDAAILIGKHGQTLESLQYIFNQLMHETKYKVMVDVSSYREKQNNKLIETVKKIASSVRQTRRRITLKPMTAFERRMVHETVKEYTDLTTKSIGVEPERRVVISLLNAPEYDETRENTRPERPYRPNNNRGGGHHHGGGRSGGGYQGRSQGGYRSNNSGGYNNQSSGGGYRDRNNQGYNNGGGNYNNQSNENNYSGGGYRGNNNRYNNNQSGEGGYNNGGNGGYKRNYNNNNYDSRRGNYSGNNYSGNRNYEQNRGNNSESDNG